MPAIEAVLTTTPRWPSASGSLSPMAAATSRVVLKVPSAFISIVWMKESLSWGTPPRPTVRPPPTPPPATFTSIESGPRALAASIAAATSSSSTTSPPAPAPAAPHRGIAQLFGQFPRPGGVTVQDRPSHADVHQSADRRRPEATGATSHDGRTPLHLHQMVPLSFTREAPGCRRVDRPTGTIITISPRCNLTIHNPSGAAATNETLLSAKRQDRGRTERGRPGDRGRS